MPECRVVSVGATFIGKQELQHAAGISADTVGARSIHMQLVTIPTMAQAKAHKHENHETAIYILKGMSSCVQYA
jgi:uncharacterized RmlC-like cupin family protein